MVCLDGKMGVVHVATPIFNWPGSKRQMPSAGQFSMRVSSFISRQLLAAPIISSLPLSQTVSPARRRYARGA